MRERLPDLRKNEKMFMFMMASRLRASPGRRFLKGSDARRTIRFFKPRRGRFPVKAGKEINPPRGRPVRDSQRLWRRFSSENLGLRRHYSLIGGMGGISPHQYF